MYSRKLTRRTSTEDLLIQKWAENGDSKKKRIESCEDYQIMIEPEPGMRWLFENTGNEAFFETVRQYEAPQDLSV